MKVHLPTEIHDKIMYWVRNSEIEVSGLGKVVLDKETQTFKVVSAMLLPQRGTGTTTQIEAKDVAKAMFETKDDEGVLAFWWHSHVRMQAFWSGTDVATIEDTAQGGLCVATVFNHQGDSKTSVAFKCKGPFGTDTIVRYDDITLEVPQREKTERELEWQRILDTQVAKPQVHVPLGAEYKSKWHYDSTLNRMVQVPETQGFLHDSFTKDGDPVIDFTNWRNRYDGESPKDESDMGISGMGIDADARALGVSVKHLRKVIKRGENDKTFLQYERKLFSGY